MITPKAALIYTTLPDAETARAIAGTLLDERLIACANIFGAVESVYVWQGQRESGQEIVVLFKSTEDCLDDALARLGALHPYDTPVILASMCDIAHPTTLAWLTAQTGPVGEPGGTG